MDPAVSSFIRRSILLALALLLTPQTARADDPAERGLDLFVHAPPRAHEGATIPIQLRAYGFRTVTDAQPLAGATILASWDPKSVGRDTEAIETRSDQKGHARLALVMPEGPAAPLGVLVSVISGPHQRTRRITVHRTHDEAIALHLSERAVVPLTEVATWVHATRASSGQPLKNASIEVELVEGNVARWQTTVTTDATGIARTQIPIPQVVQPDWTWTVRASRVQGKTRRATVSQTLHLRDETPAKPKMRASFAKASLLPGQETDFEITVLDAAGRPVAGQKVAYWVGTAAARPKTAEAFVEIAKEARTDQDGRFSGSASAPRILGGRRRNSRLELKAQCELQGRKLKTSASIEVGVPAPALSLWPQYGRLIPGLSQRVLLRALDSRSDPLRGEFVLSADGLRVQVKTDDHGEAAFDWKVPANVGARHPNGACASSVASTVTIRPVGELQKLPEMRKRIERCVPVDRDQLLAISAHPTVVRAGKTTVLRLLYPNRRAARRAYSLVVRRPSGHVLVARVLKDGGAETTLEIPAFAKGRIELSVAAMDGSGETATRTILVVPTTLPKLRAVVGGGKLRPNGFADVDVVLQDEHGNPLEGTIAAVVSDLRGGGATSLSSMDTRTSLLSGLYLGAHHNRRRQAFLTSDDTEDVRQALLGAARPAPLKPIFDPRASAKRDFVAGFARVIRSLEGAVFEATNTEDGLRDARRRTRGGWTFNPELFTLVTSAFDDPVLTPGGEPIVLGDLVALDRQVDYDHVARRVTRLKLFRVLEHVRTFVHDHRLLPAEWPLKDPNALLRRLVREGQISQVDLLDPWGHTLSFVRTSSPVVPFISVIPGWRLHAPGPDGRLRTEDDVFDPFERVLRSGSPYANAVGEDRLVDARYEVVVGDETVSSWRNVLESATGTILGDGSTFGSAGLGSRGYGSGSGGMAGRGGMSRITRGITTTSGRSVPPVRTDAKGRARIRVPLGPHETTYRVHLLGLPQSASSCASFVDVSVALPLSVTVRAGARWTAGDVVHAELSVRNRTKRVLRPQLTVSVAGPAQLKEKPRTIEVPPGSSTSHTVAIHADGPGLVTISARVAAADLVDELQHSLHVQRAATPTLHVVSRWVDGEGTIEPPSIPEGERASSPAYVSLEAGHDRLLEGALRQLDPDQIQTRDAQLEAFEVASRIVHWLDRFPDLERPGLRRLAETTRRTAEGRFRQLTGSNKSALASRLARWASPKGKPRCPNSSKTARDIIDGLAFEPNATNQIVLPCWDTLATKAAQTLPNASVRDLAMAIAHLVERPHRAAVARSLRRQLLVRVKSQVGGPLVLRGSRSTRSIVYSALLTSASMANDDPARYFEGLLAQQRRIGDFGGPSATRVAVQALLSSWNTPAKNQGRPKSVGVLAGPRPFVTAFETQSYSRLSVGRQPVLVRTDGGGVLVRYVQPALRMWKNGPPTTGGPVRMVVDWPKTARVNTPVSLQVTLSGPRGARNVFARIPLPPGVELASRVRGVRQMQGELRVTANLPSSGQTVLTLPIRFSLVGRLTAPEASVQMLERHAEATFTPAATLMVDKPGAN